MQEVVRRFVEQTGMSVTGCGSWIAGGYTPGRSDHDLRLLLPKGAANPGTQWQHAKRTLTRLIQEEFGAGAGEILQRTNLYAPSQLMGVVGDAEDALKVYQRVNQVPSLAHTGMVTSKTEAKFIEGIYGNGATTFTQFYETTKGKLFYRGVNGKAVSGVVDLTCFLDGEHSFSVSGMANTATQWGEHCLEELKGANKRGVTKYLTRLRSSLTKTRELARLGTSTANLTELNKILAELAEAGASVSDVSARVQRVVANAHMESAVLKRLGNTGPAGQALRAILLEGLDAKNAVGQAMRAIWDKVGTVSMFEKAVGAFVICQSLSDAAQASIEGGAVDALRVGGAEAALLASLPVGLLAKLTNEVMAEARRTGVQMVVNRQDAWDLMMGIYSAMGREKDEPDPRHNYTLERLVKECLSEARLRQVVWAQCLRATDRNIAGAPERDDALTCEAMMEKCYPVILQGWRWQRDLLVSEFLELASDVQHNPLILSYEPNPIVWAGQPVEVTVTPDSADPRFRAKLSRMRRILVLLSGTGAGITESYIWTPASSSTLDGPRRFRLSKPGVYPVKLELKLKPYAGPNPVPEPHRMLFERALTTVADVEVIDPKAKVAEPAAPPTTSPGEIVVSRPAKAGPQGMWALTRIEAKNVGAPGGEVVKVSCGRASISADIDKSGNAMWTQTWKYPAKFTAQASWSTVPGALELGKEYTVGYTHNRWGKASISVTYVTNYLGNSFQRYSGSPENATGGTHKLVPNAGAPVKDKTLTIVVSAGIGSVDGVYSQLKYLYAWVAAGAAPPPYEGVKPAP